MSPRLDELLQAGDVAPPPSETAVRRARDAALRELTAGRPVWRWRKEALAVVLSVWGLAAAVLVGAVAFGISSGALLLERAPLMLAVAGAVGLCTWSALSPRATYPLRLLGLGIAALAAALLVALRAPPPGTSALPEWVCTASHLIAGVGPLIVAWLALRNTSPAPLRSVLIGAGVGGTGALIGEVACLQGAAHVAGYHLGAWAGIILLAALAGRWLPRRAYAP